MTYEEHKAAVTEAATAMFMAEVDARYPENIEIAVEIERRIEHGNVDYVPGPVSMAARNSRLAGEVSGETFAKVSKRVLEAANVLCAALNAASADGYAFHVQGDIVCGEVMVRVLPGMSTVTRYLL